MSDNLINDVDRYLENYSNVMNDFLPSTLRHTSRYYDITNLHTSIINKIKDFSSKTKNFTSADGQCMKQMLMESLDLADRKEGTSERIMDMVEVNMYKINKIIKDIKVAHDQQNKQRKKRFKNPKRMLKWMPNLKENDTDSIDNNLNVDDSNEHSTINEAKTTKTSKKKSRLPRKVTSKFQTPITKVIDTKKNVKKRTKDNNSKTKRSTTKADTSKSSDNDSDVEPTYCICEEISYGKMVCCDNDLCPIEWFHFGCVSLTKKPKGKWYCPRCRRTTSKVMKPRNILFKELEEYNKRKEEGH